MEKRKKKSHVQIPDVLLVVSALYIPPVILKIVLQIVIDINITLKIEDFITTV